MKYQFGSNAPVAITKKNAADAKKRVLAAGRKVVKDDGLESNSHTTYAPEVKFENIKPVVNITRVKADSDGSVGVAKGMLVAGVPVTVPSNDAASTVNAMKKRCDYTPSLESMDQFMVGHKLVMEVIPEMEPIVLDQPAMERWLDTCKPGKALRMREAMMSGEWQFQGDTKHVFAKQEVLLKEHRAQPRVVYQGTDMYNMITGAVMNEISDRMKYVFSKNNPLNVGNKIIYACGASGETIGETIQSAKGTVMESDAANNDGSQSAEFRKPEAMLFKKLGAPLWFVREHARCTAANIWTRYGVKARVEGQLWSGETGTTPINSYVHMCLMQASLKKAGIVESTNIHGGDDYLGIIEGDLKEVEQQVTTVYKRSGMEAKVVHPANKGQATFYRKRYPLTSRGRLPLPSFGRVLAKLNLRANKNTQVDDRAYMSGKYLSQAYEHRHVPEIKDLLLATSATLSNKPHIDPKDTKILGSDVDKIRGIIEDTPVIPVAEFSDFLYETYKITHDDLYSAYSVFAQSAVDYAEGWTYVDRSSGKVVNKKNNSRYTPHKADTSIIRALTTIDC